MMKISEGAEAIIYETKFIDRKVIVKYRRRKSYRIRALDEILRKKRTKNEAKIQSILYEKALKVPSVVLLRKYKIFMEKIEGITLNTLIEEKEKLNKSKRLEKLIKKAGEQLGKMHLIGITHGDFTPANLVCDLNDNLWVIDFGLSEFTESDEEKALDVLLMKRSISKKLYEKFISSYANVQRRGTKNVLMRLKQIEKRGRYQSRTLTKIQGT